MTPFAMYLDEIDLACEEKRVVAAFTRRIAEIAVLSRGTVGDLNSPDPLNILSLPALLLDLDGFVVRNNDAANQLFDHELRVRQRRIFIRDSDARDKLRIYVDQFGYAAPQVTPSIEPIIVPRHD